MTDKDKPANPFGRVDVEGELRQLKAATSVTKSSAISHYHPGHVNYLTQGQFSALMRRCGFEAVNIGVNPLVSPKSFRRVLRTAAKSVLSYMGLCGSEVSVFQRRVA